MVFRVRLLGPFEVRLNGAEVTITGSVTRSLIALLALQPNRFVAADVLIDRIWTDRSPANGRATLQSAIARIRRQLGPGAITRSGDGYVLRGDPEDVDAVTMVGRLDDAELETDPVQERRLLGQALALWAEPFAGDFVEALRGTERERLVERYLRGLERRIDLDLAAGANAELCGELRTLAADHPFRESLWLRFLVALGDAGRRAEALEQYEILRSRLADHLGVDPAPELQSLHLQMLRGEPVRLDGPPAAPQQLPSDVRRFTGRSAILDQLTATVRVLVDRHACAPVIVLHGEAGAGKTALAVHWAHRGKDLFPDGQLFVELRGYASADPVDVGTALDAILRQLGVPGDRIPPDLDDRTALLRTTLASRRLLMVLDDARNADQIRPLLPGTSSTVVVVTSRHRLSSLTIRDDVLRIAVPPLPVHDARGLLRLMVRPRTLGDAAADELLELCGRLPLALAIAAEQLNRYSELATGQVISRLRNFADRIDALSGGDSPSTDLRAVLSWTYQALDETAASTFRAIGQSPVDVLPLPAVAALAGLPVVKARHAVRTLADLHLVQEVTPTRIQMHSLLRAYALERAAEEDNALVRQSAVDRLATWYLASAEAARTTATPVSLMLGRRPSVDPVLEPMTFATASEAPAWFDEERQSLLAIVTSAAATGRHEAAARIAFSLWEDLERINALAEAARVQQIALDSAHASGIPAVIALAHNQLGATLGLAAEFSAAVAELEQCLDLFVQLGNDKW